MPLQRRTDSASQCIFCAFRAASRPHPSQRSSRLLRPQNAHPRTFTSASPPLQAKETPFELPSFIRKETVRPHNNGQDWVPQRGPLIRKVALEEGGRGDERGPRAYDVFKKTRFKRVVLDRLDAIEPKLRGTPIFEGLEKTEVERLLGGFRWSVRERLGGGDELRRDRFGGGSGKGRERDKERESELEKKLFNAMKERGQNGLDAELQYTLYNHVLGKNFTPDDIANQKSLADLRYPTEWFPEPRQMHRTIHAHIGPTNSGKTYHALKRLESAKAGLYAGPLRLLAHEVYTRLNAGGKMCALVTGEEQRLPPGWQEAEERVVSATVEMTSLSSRYDVAVIDEIQMLGSLERGFAWTQALLGLQAKEIHLCGETRSLPIIRELAAACGDKLVVHEYERLTKLQMDEKSLEGSFKELRKGDCIVTFSVVNIHALRTEVERKTGRRAAVVYGSLPPETRAQQARLFNEEGNEYDYLIASDAVGMGLNLSIKRIIFETVHKFHSGKSTTLSVSEIRQIAGRAGRYRTSQQAIDAAKDGQILDPLPPESEKISGDIDAITSPSTEPSEETNHSTKTEPDLSSTPHLDASEPVYVKSSNITRPTEIEEFLHPINVGWHSSLIPNAPSSRFSGTKSTTSSSGAPTETEIDLDLSTRATFDPKTIGLVTTIDSADYPLVKSALETEPPPLTFATIQPPPGIVQRFASYFPPGTPFSYVLLRLTELSETSETGRYRIWHKPELAFMADLIHKVQGLSTEDRMIFINAPAGIREMDAPRAKLLRELASCVGAQREADLLSLQHMPLDILDQPTEGSKTRLKGLEELHKGLVLYLWLSFRFPGVFSQRPLGNYVKEMVEGEIEETLRLMTFKPGVLRRKEMRERTGSRVEAEIDRILRESLERRNREAAEASGGNGEGETSFDGEEGAMGISEAVEGDEVREGESMPEDDEGAYPEEDGEDSGTDSSAPDGKSDVDPSLAREQQQVSEAEKAHG